MRVVDASIIEKKRRESMLNYEADGEYCLRGDSGSTLTFVMVRRIIERLIGGQF